MNRQCHNALLICLSGGKVKIFWIFCDLMTLTTLTFYDETTGDCLGEPLGETSRPTLCKRGATTPESLSKTFEIDSQVTHEVQTRASGSAAERFVQAVRLASCDFNMKTGGRQDLMTV